HPDCVSIRNDLARVLGRLKRFPEATKLLERSLADYESTVGPDHPDYAWCLRLLGEVTQGSGDLAKAEDYCRRALAIEQRVDANNASTAVTLRRRGEVLSEKGEYASAQHILEEALGVYHRLTPYHHTAIADCECFLGACLARQGHYLQSEDLLVRGANVL